MSDRMFLLPWNERSVGARTLSKALGIRRLRTEGSALKGASTTTIINWGASEAPPEVHKCTVLNKPTDVAIAIDKVSFFDRIGKQARVPEYTRSVEDALDWARKGELVFARTKTRGSQGEGIVMFDKPADFVKANLFTKYIPKKEEYRVHVLFGSAVLVQQKVLRATDDAGNMIDPTTVNWKVRNLRNGFIFKINDVKAPDDVINQALNAFTASNLDFGAFDVIWNQKQGSAYVLEANTAPGLEGNTIEIYTREFKQYLGI